VRNPAFDVTPSDLITAIVTDRRVVDLAAHRDRSARPAYLGPSLNEEEA
jgi:methylthioribose-1-phosphate isomerase